MTDKYRLVSVDIIIIKYYQKYGLKCELRINKENTESERKKSKNNELASVGMQSIPMI